MDWQAAVFWLCVLAAFSLGAYRVAQSPAWWTGMAVHVLRHAWPTIRALIIKPESPEDRAARQLAERRGEDWNPTTKRPRDR